MPYLQGGVPQIIQVLRLLDYFSIETHSFGDLHFKKLPVESFFLLEW